MTPTRRSAPKRRPAGKRPVDSTPPSASDEDGTLTPEEEAEEERLRYERDVQDRVLTLELTEEAKRRVAEKKAGALVIPKPVRLDRFLRREIPGARFLIDGLWPADGNVMYSAQRKVGKTTAVGNLCRSLVDGDPFMDHFEVMETRSVALLDFEMTEVMLQEWMKRQGIRNRRSVSLLPLRGMASTFQITDDKTRARWARMIEDTGAEVLILDPLRPIIDALGLKEANEVGPLLQAFAALKVEAGIREGLVVHHHGHGAQRAVGDSRLETWPDAMWNGTMEDPNDLTSIHYFQALGRDVHVPRGVVLMDDFNRLEFKTDAEDESKSIVYDRLVAWLTQALAEDEEAVANGEELRGHEPGERKSGQIERAGIKGITKHTVAGELAAAVKANRVRVRDLGTGRPKWYSLP